MKLGIFYSKVLSLSQFEAGKGMQYVGWNDKGANWAIVFLVFQNKDDGGVCKEMFYFYAPAIARQGPLKFLLMSVRTNFRQAFLRKPYMGMTWN